MRTNTSTPDLERRAAQAMRDARKRLYLSKKPAAAFFASLALKMQLVQDWNVPTLCTDGKVVRYNPEFVCGLSDREVIGVSVHETMHPSQKHHLRHGNREPRRCNLAGDLAINALIREAGFTLPKCGIFPGEGSYKDIPPGLSMEEIYDRLPNDGGAGADPGGCGGFCEPEGGPSALAEQEAAWAVNVAEAAQVAALRGKLPGSLARLVEQVLSPEVPWHQELREFVSQVAKDDYCWLPPNRRMLAQGLYAASLSGERIGRIAVAIDCSGSCWHEDFLVRCNSELCGILESYDCELDIFYHDTDVQHVERWTRDNCGKLAVRGGGGTSHVEVFERIMEEETACVVCITDMATDFPPDPGVPTLWVAVDSAVNGPFGRTIRVRGAKR